MQTIEDLKTDIQNTISFYETTYKRSIDAFNAIERPVQHVSEFLNPTCAYNLLAEFQDLSLTDENLHCASAVQKINNAGWHVVEFEIRYAQYLLAQGINYYPDVWMLFCRNPLA